MALRNDGQHYAWHMQSVEEIFKQLDAGVVTLLLADFIDASVIYAVVLLNATIGFAQEYKAEESIRALKRLLPLKAIVVRDGFEQEINAELLVSGDIVLLQSGQRVPADLRLIRVKELQIDESTFTGESIPVFKTRSEGRCSHSQNSHCPRLSA